MKIEFIGRENGPKNLISEAELHFGPEDGILNGLRLVGFSLWTMEKGDPAVTMPARAWDIGGDRKFYDLLRVQGTDSEPMKAFKAAIIAEWKEQRDAAISNLRELEALEHAPKTAKKARRA